MKLEDLGYNPAWEQLRQAHHLEGFGMGRVIAQHKERYLVRTDNDEFESEITGQLRFTAKSREDFPAVGDWVALVKADVDFAVIHSILPRFSLIKRPAVGQLGEIQVIAANIDVAFLVQAADRDFNINRLERYLTICHSSGVEPIILLTKIDLIDEQQRAQIMESISLRIQQVPLMAISNETQTGYEALRGIIEKGKTYCMLGSSGVGKSTLVNNLSGQQLMRTDSISQSTQKGRHVTSHRELIVLEKGGILIDNPGMREVGLADASGGLAATFNQIAQLSQHCKFKDCSHLSETGCAVMKAVENGQIDRTSYENYLKMKRENNHFESTLEERRKKNKVFGKMMKNYKKGGYKKKGDVR